MLRRRFIKAKRKKKNKFDFPIYCDGDKDTWRKLSDQCKKRDNYTCQVCFISKKENPSIILHASHKISKAKGGKDVLNNLITKCDECHKITDKHYWMKTTGIKRAERRRYY